MPGHRAVAFSADDPLAYALHLRLRTASRLQRVVAEVPAGSAVALAAATAALPWADLLGRRPLRVEAHATDAGARALGDLPGLLGAAVRQAAPAVRPAPGDLGPEDAATLVAHVRGGRATLGLDTAGKALHKRGWRVPGHPAVLQETLAAAVLRLAGYDGREALYDPCCGSGTLLVEAAYVALDKGPLIHRKRGEFALEHLGGFDRALWRRVGDEVRGRRLPEPPALLAGSDLRADYVEVARRGALRARVEKHLRLWAAPLEDAVPPAPTGLLVANLPYGERIGRGGLPALYASVGRVLRERFGAWRVALLVPADAPTAALGLRPDRVHPLRNGALEVRLLVVGP